MSDSKSDKIKDDKTTELMELMCIEANKVFAERIEFNLPIKRNEAGQILFYQDFPNHEEEVKKAKENWINSERVK